MIAFTAAIATILAGAVPELAHQANLDHRGSTFELRYEPHLTTKAKTVGTVAGTRMSTQRCRWSVAVQVQRHIAQSGQTETLSRLLPETRQFSGDLPGDCRGKAKAIETAQAAKTDAIREHVAAVARNDTALALAEIDAAHALAMK